MAHAFYESHGKERLPIIASHLKEISDSLTSEGIVHWLDWGSLLGAYREGKQLNYDKDVDLGISADNIGRIKELFLAKNNIFSLSEQEDLSLLRYFYNESPSQVFSYEYLYIDIYSYNLVDGKYVSTNESEFGESIRDMSSPVNISFEGFEFPCPGDTLNSLKAIFGVDDISDSGLYKPEWGGDYPGLDVNYWSE